MAFSFLFSFSFAFQWNQHVYDNGKVILIVRDADEPHRWRAVSGLLPWRRRQPSSRRPALIEPVTVKIEFRRWAFIFIREIVARDGRPNSPAAAPAPTTAIGRGRGARSLVATRVDFNSRSVDSSICLRVWPQKSQQQTDGLRLLNGRLRTSKYFPFFLLSHPPPAPSPEKKNWPEKRSERLRWDEAAVRRPGRTVFFFFSFLLGITMEHQESSTSSSSSSSAKRRCGHCCCRWLSLVVPVLAPPLRAAKWDSIVDRVYSASTKELYVPDKVLVFFYFTFFFCRSA